LVADDRVAWGNAFFSLHRYDDALQKYQEALAENDKYCPARIARGFLYFNRPHGTQIVADLRQAEKDFRWGVDCDSRNKFAQTNLCSTLIREWANSQPRVPQLLVDAQDHCKRALDSDPRFVVAAVNLAYSLYRQGKHQDSLAYFENIGQQYPTDSALFVNHGYFLYLEYLAGNKDALQPAIEKTQKAFSLNGESYAAADNLGFFYYETHDYAQAHEYWLKADPLRGNDVDSTAGLALALSKLGHEEEALVLLARVVQSNDHYRNPVFLRENWRIFCQTINVSDTATVSCRGVGSYAHSRRRAQMPSAQRRASAPMVEVGFTAALVVNELPSTMNRFFRSCAWCQAFTTDRLGSVPMRAVPSR